MYAVSTLRRITAANVLHAEAQEVKLTRVECGDYGGLAGAIARLALDDDNVVGSA
jgi:hypothetical protein